MKLQSPSCASAPLHEDIQEGIRYILAIFYLGT